jgi:O-antigen ligase
VNINRAGILVWPFVGALAWVVARVFLAEGATTLGIVLGGFGIAWLVLKVNEAVLPILVLMTLSLGSSYRGDLAERSFYLRFFLLGLVALRGVFLLLITRSQKEKDRFYVTPVHVLFLLIGVYGLFTSFASVVPAISAQRATSFLLLFFVIYIYFWLRSETAGQCVEYGVAIWRYVFLLLGIGFLFLVVHASGMFVAGRLRLVVGNPNQLGHYCAIMALIALWFAIDRTQGRARTLGRILLFLLSVALVWSGSRGGLIAGLVAIAAQCALCYREKALLILLVAGIVGSVHLLTSNSAQRPDEGPTFLQETVLRQETLESGSGRTEVWKAAQRLIARQPLLGYGFGITDNLFAMGYFPDLPLEFQGGHIHDGYLEELVNLGWVGASLIFASIAYLLLAGIVGVWRPVVRTENYRFTCALLGVVLAGTVSGIFESWFTSVGSVFCFPFWFSGALLLKMTTKFNDWRVA